METYVYFLITVFCVCVYASTDIILLYMWACLCAVQHAEPGLWCVHFSQPTRGRLFEMHPCMLIQENKKNCACLYLFGSICAHCVVNIHLCNCVCEQCAVVYVIVQYVCNKSLQCHWSALLHCTTSCPSLGRRQPPPGHSSKVATGQSSPSAYPANARIYTNTKSVWCKSRETPVKTRLTKLKLCGLNKCSDM